MKKHIVLIGLLTLAPNVEARTLEENVLAFYTRVVDGLNQHGFEGPFCHEIARLALIRQIHEDGIQRDHSKSMVGMIPGGINKEVMLSLGLQPGKTNPQGYKLTTVPAHDGQRSYAIYGPRANVVSTVAIALVWDRYVQQLECFTDDETRVWNQSKAISRRIDEGTAKPQAKVHYRNVLAGKRREILHRANRIYGSNAARRLTRMAEQIRPLCNLVMQPASRTATYR